MLTVEFGRFMIDTNRSCSSGFDLIHGPSWSLQILLFSFLSLLNCVLATKKTNVSMNLSEMSRTNATMIHSHIFLFWLTTTLCGAWRMAQKIQINSKRKKKVTKLWGFKKIRVRESIELSMFVRNRKPNDNLLNLLCVTFNRVILFCL